ncbi:MAG: hypothetical protein WBC44_08915 [Planctomycetaceae bacterium]
MLSIETHDKRDERPPLELEVAHRIDVIAALAVLSRRQRDALLVRHQIELPSRRYDSVQECAAAYRVSDKQIYADAIRARNRLRKTLGEEYVQCH